MCKLSRAVGGVGMDVLHRFLRSPFAVRDATVDPGVVNPKRQRETPNALSRVEEVVVV